MMYKIFSIIILISLLSFSCKEETKQSSEKDLIEITFSFTVNKGVYQKSDYGEAPQIAIWLEHHDSGFYKTVWVTQRAGKNMWVGKIKCPVALPYWESRNDIEQKPTTWKNLVDAVTGATDVTGTVKKSIMLKKGTLWKYFIEVNVSGDYNDNFPYWSDKGLPDTEGNGQPSIVYSGRITAGENSISNPVLIGRTNQHVVHDSLIKETCGITTAKELLLNIRVKS